MNVMPEKINFPGPVAEAVPAIIPVENFKSEFKDQIFELLEKSELIDFNNEERMKFFLERLAEFWQKKENGDFALFLKSLGTGDAGVESLSEEEQTKLMSIFNEALLSKKKHSFFVSLANYVDAYPERKEEDEENPLFQSLSADEKKAFLKRKEGVSVEGFDIAELNIKLYLEYLSVLRHKLKEEAFAEFQERNRDLSEDDLSDNEFYSFKELEDLERKSGADRLKYTDISGGRIILKKIDGLESEEDQRAITGMLESWLKYSVNKSDLQKVSHRFIEVLALRRKLQRKERDLEVKRSDFIRNPEQDKFKKQIDNDDLLDYWYAKVFSSGGRSRSLLQDRLSAREKAEFLVALENNKLLEFTAEWAAKRAEHRLATLGRTSGYFKNDPDRLQKLRDAVGDLLEMWPDDLSFYGKAEQKEISSEWFQAFRAHNGDESTSGKFVRLDYLLRNADNPKAIIFVKDDESYDRLLGEVREMLVKEIQLNPKEFKIVRNIVMDNGFAHLFENEKFESLLQDILENEDLSYVQEDLWYELIDKIGDYLKKEISIYVDTNDDSVAEDMDLIDSLEKEIILEPFQYDTDASAYDVIDLRFMYDYYRGLEGKTKHLDK